MEPQLWDGVPSSLAKECGKINVLCRNGLKPLKSCYRGTQELAPVLTDDMNFLVIADPDSSKWHLLRGMGVTFEPDAKLFVDQLMRLKRNFQSSDMTRVDNIYQSLVKHLQGSSNVDREFVRCHDLVHLFHFPSNLDNLSKRSHCYCGAPVLTPGSNPLSSSRKSPISAVTRPAIRIQIANTLPHSQISWESKMERRGPFTA
jgi:hypothetical protein